MFQFDDSAELQVILDGVFKPRQREERRARQRYSRRGLMNRPLKLANYSGVDPNGPVTAKQAEAATRQLLDQTRSANHEELVGNGSVEGRVINPPPPTREEQAKDDPAADLYGLGYVPPIDRIWSEGA